MLSPFARLISIIHSAIEKINDYEFAITLKHGHLKITIWSCVRITSRFQSSRAVELRAVQQSNR
jgi:hypothetical protein